MKKSTIHAAEQTDLVVETTPSPSTAPEKAVDLLEDTPDEVKADLRKYNRTEIIVRAAVTCLTSISTITSAQEVDDAQEAMKSASAVRSALDKKRLELGKPYREQQDRINTYGNNLLAPIQPAIDRVKALVLAFDKREKDRIRKERTEARKEHLTSLGLTYDPGKFHYLDPLSGQVIQTIWIDDLPDDGFNSWLTRLADNRERVAAEKLQQLQQDKEGATFFGEETTEIDQKIQEALKPERLSVGTYSMPVAPKTKGLTKRWVYEVTSEQEVPRAYLQVNEKAVKDAIAGGARQIPGIRIFQEESISIR